MQKQAESWGLSAERTAFPQGRFSPMGVRAGRRDGCREAGWCCLKETVVILPQHNYALKNFCPGTHSRAGLCRHLTPSPSIITVKFRDKKYRDYL